MNKKLLGLGLLMLGAFSAKAQYPVKTIREVQFVSQTQLQLGNDASAYGAGDTIRIRGVVMMDAGLSTLIGGKQVWIQTNDGSPFSGIDVYQPFPSGTGTGDGGTGILQLVEGDSVEVTGVVEEFQGETEFVPINTNPATPIVLLGGGIEVKSTLINVADLNDANRNNNLMTGEQWEGMYVEFRDVTVATVDPFSNGARVSFNIVDALGNRVNVSDRFMAMKLPAGGGTFVPPNVGDFLSSIKGVIIHSKNNRGYELHPFKSGEMIYGAAAPSIVGISKNVNVPNNTEAVTITATITDADGVNNADLYYAVGSSNNNYLKVAMTANGNSYSAVIPAQADGSFVKFFIEATDMSNPTRTSRIPNVPSVDPMFYVVRNAGLGIYDLQYTPFRSGNSGYVDQIVTVTGVATASSSDLGFVYLQQEGQSSWAGISIAGGAGVETINTGDKVTITGTVKESFGLTRLENITNVAKVGTGVIEPIIVDVDSFRTATLSGSEPYESMLVKFKPAGQKLYVVNQNADAPDNFAEYRVGRDTLDGGAGCRVLVARVTSTSSSSLNVSYVMDSTWKPNPTVPQVVVKVGDSMTSLTGIMTYTFSNMKILPRTNADFEDFSRPAVGINSKHVNKGKALVYPNPASQSLSLDYIMPENSTSISMNVYNMMGTLVRSIELNGTSGTATLDLSAFANGTYVYSITSENMGTLNNGRFVVVK